jgi:formylglycine-generating enzyme required for sulfatase activity
MTFVSVPPGTLRIGNDSKRDEAPAHPVEFRSPVWIQSTEVTQDQWTAVMGTAPWTRLPEVREAGRFPAVHMSWRTARAFIDKLNALDPGHGYRLPSEAEWERVCRAAGADLQSDGNDRSPLGDYAWFDENAGRAGERFAHAVALKKPNALGVYDIRGNVWEWCEDNYRDGYQDAPTDGGPRLLKDVFSHVYRGGGWNSPARSASCTERAGLDEDDHSPAIGLRVAASRLESSPQR